MSLQTLNENRRVNSQPHLPYPNGVLRNDLIRVRESVGSTAHCLQCSGKLLDPKPFVQAVPTGNSRCHLCRSGLALSTSFPLSWSTIRMPRGASHHAGDRRIHSIPLPDGWCACTGPGFPHQKRLPLYRHRSHQFENSLDSLA
jgi:hypothetical protein